MVSVRLPDTERTVSMLNQSTTLGDPRLPARFWDKVRVREDGCWEWTAQLVDGYGYFRVGSLTDGTRRHVYSHRYAYEHLVGEVPAGLQCDHLCRNRACVYPGHIDVVTCRTNLLRGNGVSARNARKTHCAQGHAYDLLNTHITKDGSRRCRACDRQWHREGRERLRNQEVSNGS